LLPGSVLPNAGRPAGVGPSVTALARKFTEKAIYPLGAVMADEKHSKWSAKVSVPTSSRWLVTPTYLALQAPLFLIKKANLFLPPCGRYECPNHDGAVH
jgi:hypothetical protein